MFPIYKYFYTVAPFSILKRDTKIDFIFWKNKIPTFINACFFQVVELQLVNLWDKAPLVSLFPHLYP